jgi:hypothetical protein
MTGSASERSRSPSTSPAPRRTHSPSGKTLASRQGEAGRCRPEGRAETQPPYARKGCTARARAQAGSDQRRSAECRRLVHASVGKRVVAPPAGQPLRTTSPRGRLRTVRHGRQRTQWRDTGRVRTVGKMFR